MVCKSKYILFFATILMVIHAGIILSKSNGATLPFGLGIVHILIALVCAYLGWNIEKNRYEMQSSSISCCRCNTPARIRIRIRIRIIIRFSILIIFYLLIIYNLFQPFYSRSGVLSE